MMFYFLSRPRKYTVTPEDVQIGVNFDSYRGQPDLLDHARSTVRDPPRREGVRGSRRRDAEGPPPLRRPRHRQDVPRQLHRGRGAAAVRLPRRELPPGRVRRHVPADGREAVPRRPRPGPALRGAGQARRLHRLPRRARRDRPVARRQAGRRDGHRPRRRDDGRHGRRRPGPERPAEPDGLADRAHRGPLALQGAPLVRPDPRPGEEPAARVRDRRDEPAGGPRRGARPARAVSTGSSRSIRRMPTAAATSSTSTCRRRPTRRISTSR